MKRIAKLALVAAYNLRLERAFFRDRCAVLPPCVLCHKINKDMNVCMYIHVCAATQTYKYALTPPQKK